MVECSPGFRKLQSIPALLLQWSRRNSFRWIALTFLSVAVGCSSTSLTSPSSPTSPGGFSNASLKGSYAYTLGGSYFNSATGNGFYLRSGTFVADGSGNITSGEDDFVQAGGVATTKTTGSYAVADDGTGILNLVLPNEQLRLAITIAPGGKIYVIEFDATASGAGQAVQQDAAALASTPTGTYVFRFHSYEPSVPSPGSVSAVGLMTLSTSSIVGNEDAVRDGTFSSVTLTGALTGPDSTGRGTITITDSVGFVSHFIYYVVDADTLNLLETDPGPLGAGNAEAQSGTPFSNSSVKNNFVFHSRGDTLKNLDGVNSAGVFSSDGNGRITGGSYDSGQDGVPIQNASLTGTYSVDPNGRLAITLNPTQGSQVLSPIPEVAWMVNSSRAFLLVDVPGRAEDGAMDQQQSGPFSNASLNGAYSFVMFGYDSQSPIEIDRVGPMTFDGGSTVTLTNYFANRSGSRNQTNAAGKYMVSANGRVSEQISGVTNDLALYLISGSSGYLVLGDTGAEVSGSLSQPVVPSR
jgi:hypothetical protein